MGTTRGSWYIECVKAGRPIGSYRTAYTKRLNYRKTHCPKGHEYSDVTDETTVYRKDGARVCRVCYRERKRGLYRRYLYSLTMEEYRTMLERQRHMCMICGRVPEADETLAVDHDHRTGAIRGLLCGPCNRALGGFGDDVGRLRAAVAYLERSAKDLKRGGDTKNAS
jgi:hypothetical protein